MKMPYFNHGKALASWEENLFLVFGTALSVQVDREGRNCWGNSPREQFMLALSPVVPHPTAPRLPGKPEQAQPYFHGPAGSCSEEKEVALLHLLYKRI